MTRRAEADDRHVLSYPSIIEHVENQSYEFRARHHLDSATEHRYIHLEDLTWDEFNRYTEAVECVERYLNGEFESVRQAHSEFEEAIRSSFLHQRWMERGIDSLEQLERSVANVAASLRSYVDRTSSAISTRHGKHSAELSRFVGATNRAFDKSFAYRVMYQLRNIDQHDSQRVLIPKIVRGGPPDLRLSREFFSKSSTNASVRREVSELPEDPEVIALCREVLRCLEQLNWTARSVLNRDIAEAASLIHWYFRRAKFHGGWPDLVALNNEGVAWVMVSGEVFEFASQFPIPPLAEKLLNPLYRG